jgi:hypothetical protein
MSVATNQTVTVPGMGPAPAPPAPAPAAPPATPAVPVPATPAAPALAAPAAPPAASTPPAPDAAPAFRSVPRQAPFPHALKVPVGWKGGSANPMVRNNTLHALCEPLLGVGFGKAHARAENSYFYVSAAVGRDEGRLFHSRHALYPKQPRFDWERRTDLGKGVWFGWLTAQAIADAALPPDPEDDDEA